MAEADIAGCHGAGQTVLEGFQRRSRQTFDPIAGPHQATLGEVNGYAHRVGFESEMCCDLAFANERAKLGHMEIKLSLIPRGCGTLRLPSVQGAMQAKEVQIAGRMTPVAEAVETGAPDALMPRATEFAKALAEFAPTALREAKCVGDDGLIAALNAGLTLKQRALDALFATEGGYEGIVAFAEERAPAFKGAIEEEPQ